MRDKIGKILSLQGCEGYDAIGEILSLLAPELERARLFILNKDYIDRFYSEAEKLRADAEKWRRVVETAKMFDVEGCEGCPMVNTPYHICGNAYCVVQALEGEGEKG